MTTCRRLWLLVVLATTAVAAGCSGGDGETVPEKDGNGEKDRRHEEPDARADAGDGLPWDLRSGNESTDFEPNPDIIFIPPDCEADDLDFPEPDLHDTFVEEPVEEPGTKIKEIQQTPESLTCQVLYGTMLVAIDLQIKHVVLTAPLFPYSVIGTKLDGFYVADQDGGDYSGVIVTYPSGQLPKLKPGTVLSMVGEHKESFCFTTFNAKSVVVEKEDGAEAKPVAVAVAKIIEDPERYEGMLLKIEDVTVTSANPDAADGLDKREFEVSGLLRVGNDYGLSYMSPGTDARKVGDIFASIVGVLKFGDGKWHLMPRFDSDMLKEGEVPPEPAPEVVELPPEQPPEPFEEVLLPPEPDIIEVFEEPEIMIEPDLPGPEPETAVEEATMDIPAEPPSPVVITEIMYDPAVIADDKGEWFELFNASDEPVDMNGWRIEDVKGQIHILQPGAEFLILPGEFLVFGGNNQESTNGGVEVQYQYPASDFTLDNKADSVVLKNLFGQVIDEVHYSQALLFPVAKGASIELLHPHLDNTKPDHWKVATVPYGDASNKGTPGTGSW